MLSWLCVTRFGEELRPEVKQEVFACHAQALRDKAPLPSASPQIEEHDLGGETHVALPGSTQA